MHVVLRHRRNHRPRLAVGALLATSAAAGCAVAMGVLLVDPRTHFVAPLVVAIILFLAGLRSSRRSAAYLTVGASAAAVMVAPLLGAAALLAGAVVAAVRYRALLHPMPLLAAPLAAYVLIGAPEVSSYRGSVQSATTESIVIAALVLVLAAAAIAGPMRPLPPLPRTRFSMPPLIVALLPGLVGFALLTATAGAVVVNPTARFGVSGVVLLLFETLIAGTAALSYAIFARRRPAKAEVAALLLLVALTLNSGYRGWLLISSAAVTYAAIRHGVIKVSPLRLVVGLASVTLVIAGFQEVRRITDPERVSSSEAARIYEAERIPPAFRDLHFSLRESIALTQRLTAVRDSGGSVGSSLLLADVRTAMPGKQASGGDLIAQAFGRVGGGGLTPGLVGSAYYDLGRKSIVVFVLIGAAVGLLWRRTISVRHWEVGYILALIYSLHLFHRGIPKLSYIVVPVMAVAVLAVASSQTSRETRGF